MAERFSSRLADVIRRPLITEKATRALELNQYTFEAVSYTHLTLPTKRIV